jgi:AcrR family transcriptional regulator
MMVMAVAPLHRSSRASEAGHDSGGQAGNGSSGCRAGSFEGFSFQDIADEVGIRKASLYHHFDSKDPVAIAVLKRGGDWVSGQLEATKELAPPERLERYFDLFRDLHGKAERMCPGGSFAPVFGAESPPVQRGSKGSCARVQRRARSRSASRPRAMSRYRSFRVCRVRY